MQFLSFITRFRRHAGLLAVVMSSYALAQHDHDGLEIGRTATNQINAHASIPLLFTIGPSPFPGIDGFARADIPFESATQDHPEDDLFSLPAGVDIRAVLIASSGNAQVFAGTVPTPVGQEILVGPPFFHFLPVWNVTQGPVGSPHSLTFRFRDASGTLSESDPVTLTFVPIPTPAGMLVFAALGAATWMGRRRITHIRESNKLQEPMEPSGVFVSID
jgi:hypothetical protein